MSYGYVTPTDGFTVECWFRHTVIPTGFEAIVGQQSQSTTLTNTNPSLNQRQFLVWLSPSTGALRIQIMNKAGILVHDWTDASPSGYENDSEWHFFALRLASDKKTFTIFLDSEKKTESTLATGLDWIPGGLTFGGAYAPHLGNFGNFLFSGGLAYCAAWDHALTDSRILEHYTAGSGGTVFYGDDEVTRLERLYSYAGVPVQSQRFGPAVTVLQGLKVAAENALEKVIATSTDAGGTVFADGQGTLVYQNRRYRYNRPIKMVLSESRISAPNTGIEFSTDDTKVYNDVRASRPFGGSARLRNKASEFEFGQRVYELRIAVTDDEEMRNAGTWIVERYGVDRLRVSGISLSAESSDDIQRLAEDIEIGDAIAFDELPENSPFSYMEFIVEGISIDANFRDSTWELSLQLSPADLWKVFQVGVSALGDGSRIAY